MLPNRARRSARSAVAALAVVGVLAACGDDDADGSAGAGAGASASTLGIVAEFYPLQFVAERVGGAHVAVGNLAPAGAEPHDLELTPRDTASLQDADVVVYLAGFAPAIDDAVRDVGDGNGFDVAPAANLDLEGDGEHDEEGDEHDEEGGEHDRGGVDPHFWLDPTKLADVADALAERLGEVDPDHAAEFTANAATLREELEALDDELATGLASCESTSLVTSHAAFGYLAQRYGLTQVGISGLSPDEEPSPARLAEVTEFVQDHDVVTIYYETLVDPAVAETLAAETGVEVAVLDPIEGLTDESAGDDYFAVMRANRETLRAGQRCT